MKCFFTINKLLLFGSVLFLQSFFLAFAVGNDFTIGLTVVADSTAPSVPTGLSATPVSSSQINLSWVASTDNVAVVGYVLFRDTNPLATTTGLSYSDTGLSPSTGYGYNVRAFDSSGNYSALSSVVYATTSVSGGGGGGGDTTAPVVTIFSPVNGAVGVASTTLLQMTMSELINKASGNILIRRYVDNSIVDTIPVSGTQVSIAGSVVSVTPSALLLEGTQYYIEVANGTFLDQSGNSFAGVTGNSVWAFTTIDTVLPVISNLSASTTYTTGTISFNTNESALSTIEWGTTLAYGDGLISEVSYGTAHSISVSGLATNTLYFFRLTAKDPSNNTSLPFAGSFSTQNPPPPPDVTPPGNPTSFTGNPSLTNILLTWTNPLDGDFSVVRILRKTSGYPLDPSDGILVYEGNAITFNDTGLATGTRYYYTAFARDVALNYSSGVLYTGVTDSGITPPPPPAPPPPTPPPSPAPSPSPSPGGGSISTSTIIIVVPPITASSSGPFVDMSATATPNPVIVALTLRDFTFTEMSNPEKLLELNKDTIRTNGEMLVKVSVPYTRLPKVLTTIALTVTDPLKKNPDTTYLLRENRDHTAFEGMISVYRQSGKQPFSIDILDHDRRAVTKIAGIFDVFMPPRLPSVLPLKVQDAIAQTIEVISAPVADITPFTAPLGVAVGVSQAVLLATNVGSFYDLYLLLLKLIGLLTGLFRRKRHEPWGVVYDSVTKRPLDPAYVIARLREASQSKGEAITDLDGRYGFFLNPGEYIIEANKTHYKFPSEKLKGKSRDELYDNLYFGDAFQVRRGGVVQYNIPLDPVEFDWNEFAKNQDKVFKVYSRNESIRLWVFNIIFFVGFIFSLLSVMLTPSPLNIFIVLVYAIILSFQIFWKATHKITRIINKTTGKPLPFSIVKVWLSGVNTVVKKTVSDETGRFYFLVPPGKYFLTVEEKLPNATYREVLRTGEMELKGGVVKNDLIV